MQDWGWGYGGCYTLYNMRLFDIHRVRAIVHLSVAFGPLAHTLRRAKGNEMAALNLTPIAAAIGGAASAESKARDKWLTASKAASKAGVTVAMITKGTTKEPNAAFDAVVYETLRQFIITGISAGKTAERYDAARPDASGEEAVKGASTWTMAQIVNLTKEQLRDIDSDKLKMMRRAYMQLVDGTMMGRLRSYMDRIENPEPKEKGTKTKTATKTEPNAPLLQRGKDVLNELVAGLLSMKRDDGTAMAGIVQAHEAACEALARLGQVK